MDRSLATGRRQGWVLGPVPPLLRALQIAFLAAGAAIASSPRLIRCLLARGGRSGLLRLLGEELAALCERLGPVFVKLGQLLSVRRDLLPADLIAPLGRLQDRVVPIPFERIEESLAAGIFASFDRTPLACGSIAQVYRARLRDPDVEVAVKILRPGTEAMIERDLGLLMSAGRCVARLKAFRRIPVVPALLQLCDSIRRQADLSSEARHCQRFHDLFSGRTRVRFPGVFAQGSGPGVMVMSYFPGLRRIDDESIDLHVHRYAVEDVLQVLYGMIFTHGLIHCDLHPGNVCLLPDGTPVILDCGLTVALKEEERLAFRRFFMAVAQNDGQVVADVLLQTSLWREETFDERAFRREVTGLVGRHSGLGAGEFQVLGFVNGLFDVQRRHGLCGSPSFTMAILSLLTFEGVVKRRHPDLDFQRAATPFFSSFVAELLAASRGVCDVWIVE